MMARLWPARLMPALLILAGLLGATGHGRAEDKPDFRLDLDTGGHRGTINDLAFTPDGATLVSASDDKTIRLWDSAGGQPLRVLRGYRGDGNDGKVFAVAVSPDGRTIAAGGYFGKGVGAEPPYGDVRLFDAGTGRMTAVLPGNEYAVYAIAFSPDGNVLAAGGQDGFVYLWKRDPDAREAWTPETRLDADSERIQRIAFAAGGKRLAITTMDWGIRLFDMEAQAEIDLGDAGEALRETPVAALAVSRDGGRFATGNTEGLVQIWNAVDGALETTLPARPYLVSALAFTVDGRLAVACGYRCGEGPRVEIWVPGLSEPALAYRGVAEGSVTALAVAPDGLSLASAGGADHAIDLWAAGTGELRLRLQGSARALQAVGIKADGLAIAWGSVNPCPGKTACPEAMGVLESQLVLPAEGRFFDRPVPADGTPMRRAVHQSGGWSLRAVPGGTPRLDNAVLEVAQDGTVTHRIENDAGNGHAHESFTLIDRGLRLITGGTDGTILEYFTGTSRQSGEFIGGHTGVVHAMAAAERANLLVTAGADQTLSLWNLQTRELIASMLFAGREWIVWMPQGYYFSSDNGDRLVGWQVNQGRGREGRFIRAEQLKRYLWSPEMVRRAIILRSARAAIKEMRPDVDEELNRLLQRRPPEFDVRLAADQSGVQEGYVALEIVGGADADGEGKPDFSILSNSRNVGGVTGTRAVTTGDGRTIVQVPVEAGDNTIAITGSDAFGYVTERSVKAIGRRKTEAKKGKLYVLAIGVSRYPLLPDACNGRPCDLRFPVADAAEMARVLAERTAPLFSGVEIKLMVNREALDAEPDRAAVISTLTGDDGLLEPESDTIGDEVEDFLDRPGPDDTTILFVAGHGINIDEDYYFIPTDGRQQDGGKWRRSSLVDWSGIQKAMERAQGVRFMLIDTCHAANAFNPRLEKDAADARIVVFSATAANNVAEERSDLGHGVFTYSLLAGLRGKAKTSEAGVTLFGLADYISAQIIELTEKRQKPFYYVSGVDNMLIAAP